MEKDDKNNFLWNVEIVHCIDATENMENHIERVKGRVLTISERLRNSFNERGKFVDTIRTKVITFRDYSCDDEAMLKSPFFSLPEQYSGFVNSVLSIRTKGGSGVYRNGLEALALAMRSDWRIQPHRYRQIIMLWTNGYAYPLDAKITKVPHYPTGMPKNFDAITDEWHEPFGLMKCKAKRLILFAPECYPWSDISNICDWVIYAPTPAGDGLLEVDFDMITDRIVNNI